MRTIRNFNLKKILSLFLQQPADPLFNAKGAAIGIFLGCFPFVGLQTIVGVFIAKVLRGNIFLAAAGTWISNPLTFAPLYYFNFKVGSALLQSPYEISIDKDLMEKDINNIVFNNTKTKKYFEGKKVKRTIFVKNKIINYLL